MEEWQMQEQTVSDAESSHDALSLWQSTLWEAV